MFSSVEPKKDHLDPLHNKTRHPQVKEREIPFSERQLTLRLKHLEKHKEKIVTEHDSFQRAFLVKHALDRKGNPRFAKKNTADDKNGEGLSASRSADKLYYSVTGDYGNELSSNSGSDNSINGLQNETTRQGELAKNVPSQSKSNFWLKPRFVRRISLSTGDLAESHQGAPGHFPPLPPRLLPPLHLRMANPHDSDDDEVIDDAGDGDDDDDDDDIAVFCGRRRRRSSTVDNGEIEIRRQAEKALRSSDKDSLETTGLNPRTRRRSLSYEDLFFNFGEPKTSTNHNAGTQRSNKTPLGVLPPLQSRPQSSAGFPCSRTETRCRSAKSDICHCSNKIGGVSKNSNSNLLINVAKTLPLSIGSRVMENSRDIQKMKERREKLLAKSKSKLSQNPEDDPRWKSLEMSLKKSN